MGNWVPDFVFSDTTFNPLLPLPNAELLGSKISSWKLEDERQLLSLMKGVIRRWFYSNSGSFLYYHMKTLDDSINKV